MSEMDGEHPYSKLLDDLAPLLAGLQPFYEKTRRGPARKGSFYKNCVRASFAKAFEVVQLMGTRDGNAHFFLVPLLRGICEDLIVLTFLSKVSSQRREKILTSLMLHELHDNIEVQSHFFKVLRPFQAVLSPGPQGAVAKQRSLDDLQACWQAEGWKLTGRSTMPQIRQLAERVDLSCLYDYLYRITCDMVHFNPGVLLRSGWGEKKEMSFSAKNFGMYYTAFATIYGSCLLVLFLELLGKPLSANSGARAAVAALRRRILEVRRWPEIVTYEEMNLPLPKPRFSPVAVLCEVILSDRNQPIIRAFRAARRRQTNPSGTLTATRATAASTTKSIAAAFAVK